MTPYSLDIGMVIRLMWMKWGACNACGRYWSDYKCIKHAVWRVEGKNPLEDAGIHGVQIRPLYLYARTSSVW